MGAYSDDAHGAETIDPEATFAGCYNCLNDYGDIYLYLGGVDSYIRERVFAELADIMGVDYGYIYDQWMKCHTHTPIFDKNGNFTGYFSELERAGVFRWRRLRRDITHIIYKIFNNSMGLGVGSGLWILRAYPKKYGV